LKEIEINEEPDLYCNWEPLPGPQEMAFNSEADILGYGGAAGRGTTDL